MKQFSVTGMSCAACQARVEKAVSAVPGVSACAVSLLTNSMGVEGEFSDGDVIRAVAAAGYGASPKGDKMNASREEDALIDRETPVLLRRLIASAAVLPVLLYVSMGHGMWGFPLPAFFENNPAAIAVVQMLLAAVVMLINKKFFVSGFRAVLHGAPNMDTLVALGSSASFTWSVYALFMITDAMARGGDAGVWLHDLYFESAAMIVTLITVGKTLEARSKGRTADALKGLMKLTPKTACVVRNGAETVIPASEVVKGDIFLVRPGESVPVDGVVVEGDTAINESALTGESIPADKSAGSRVYAASVNQNGFIKCEATRVGEDTTLSQVIRMVSDAAATKAPIAKIADRVSGVFVPAVTGIALLTLVIWLMIGKPFDFSLARAISVLVISCPCALGLATPVAIMVGSGVGAKQGILFKTAASVEQTGKAQIVVLDKTGTVTGGKPEVTGICPAQGHSEEELLSMACALEKKSEHPLAAAVLREGEKRGIVTEEVTSFRALPGNGLTAVLNGKTLMGGSLSFLTKNVPVSGEIRKTAERLAQEGNTPLLFSCGNELLGIIAVADTVKEDSAHAIGELRNMGIETVLLTGDNPRTAAAIAKQAGIAHVIAGVLPDGKAQAVARLKKLGSVIMVGDGINDAPALTAADTGIAIGAGADVAVDAADAVLVNGSLTGVSAAVRLSRRTIQNIRENLFWAFFYNAVCIPLAAGCFIRLFGWQLNPMVGAAAMSLSSFCVVSNALRLNLVKIRDAAGDKPMKRPADKNKIKELVDEINREKERENMTRTLKIDGMMCPHCEARVRKALEAVEGVESAVASHEAGTAVVTLSKEVPDDVLKAAVEGADYPVLGIE